MGVAKKRQRRQPFSKVARLLTARSPVRIRLQEGHHKINVVIKYYLIACSSPLLVARLPIET